MSRLSAQIRQPERDALELAADQVIAACDGDVRAAVCALIVAKGMLEAELNEVYASSSKGYARGLIKRDHPS
ncbi:MULTISPECIES: hypothetical protein [unclassified Bradyrhizobium]|uniref:hypothetical protein n=1 Tax=unclassified Bradyrhizobium TaxID=2631580 RepID=UPI0028E34D64|nr:MULTISPECIES: hypothetical protein [unclassified Bradyrhizobium]